MKSRAQQKENTRKTLIDTAFNMFSKQGIASSTTIELAKLAQVSHGTIFLHFATRENLLFEVINDFGARLAEKFNEVALQSENTRAILKAHLQVLATSENFYTRLIEELPFLSDQIKSRFFILQASIAHHINLHIQGDIAAGTIKNIERSKLFNTWIALIHYYLINRELFCPEKSLISAMSDELIDHFLKLIKK